MSPLQVALLSVVLVSIPYMGCHGEAEECVIEGGDYCKCKLGTGHEIDLTPLKNEFLSAEAQYIWSPCGNLIDYPGSQCTAGAAACQFEADTRLSIGDIASAKFMVDMAEDVTTANLTYTGGVEERQTSILMICGPEMPGSLTFEEEKPDLHYKLLLTSKSVCLLTVPVTVTSISVGTVLCIVLIVSLFLYFSVGTIFMHAAKEAQGLDKIPNSGFWLGLPGLVKEGMLFVISPCAGGSTNSGDYEKL